MMTKITENLFLGTSQDPKALDDLKAYGINCIYNVAADLNDLWTTECLYVKFGMWDGPSPLNNIDTATSILNILLCNGYKVLVHCHAGCNRSPFVVAKYLAWNKGTDWKDEFASIKEKRPQVFIKDWMK